MGFFSPYHSRIASADDVTAELLNQMQYNLQSSVGLLPKGIDFDVIGYGCTSASAVIGEQRICALIQQQRPTTQVTNPVSAVKAALRAVDANTIGFVSPYIAEVTASIRQNLTAAGFTIAAMGSFNESADAVVAKMTEQSILNALTTVANDRETPCDAIFVSCTNLRVARIIEQAELALGIPIISSNQALIWHMLRLANIKDSIDGFGRLFLRQLDQHWVKSSTK